VNRNKVPEKRVAQSRSNTSYDLRPKTNVTLITYPEHPDHLDTISLCCDPTDL
jgi:hypothetical protein